MEVLVPAQGLVTMDQSALVATRAGVMGPIPVGVYVRQVRVSLQVDELSVIRWAGSLGASNEDTEGALLAGLSVIQRSTTRLANVPCLEFRPRAAGQIEFVLPVGLDTKTGTRWFVWRMHLGVAAVTTMVVGLEITRLDRVRD